MSRVRPLVCCKAVSKLGAGREASRPHLFWRVVVYASWLLVGLGFWSTDRRANAATETENWPTPYRQDANLFDICFVNAQWGWAVGDRGTILHTQDGGETWQLQACPFEGRLEAVQFLDTQHGWAVGGATTPYTHRSSGYVVRTEDGGQTWQRDPDQFLPWLTGVHFTDIKQGIAYGIPSAMFPSAVYHTRDGGLHWTPWPGASTGWVDAVIDARGQGLLIDRSGQLVQVQPGGLTPQGRLKQETRLPLRLSDNGQGQLLLCGNQGLVQVSLDRGGSWLTPRGLPDAGVLSEFDWQGVASIGTHTWMVGVPGSRVLMTGDGGQSWQLCETGQHLPLYAVEFVDAQHGWAVGAIGTVLVTHDGGRTWAYQRGERHHLAVLGVFGQAEQIPWELVAQLAAGEGYWTRIEVLGDSVALPARSGQTPVSTRLHEATVMLGGVGANLIQALPAPDSRLHMPAGMLRRQWDRITQADSTTQLTEYLVRQIRTWQPDLVILSEPTHADDGLSQITRQIVLQATEQAADATQFDTQLRVGLAPWRVSRVTTLSRDTNDNGYGVNASQLVMSLGQSVAQLADRARANLSADYLPGPSQLRLRTLDGDAPAQRGLFLSKADAAGAISRRTNEGVADDLRLRNQQAQRRRNLEILLRNTTQDDEAIWQQAMHLAAELSPENRGELFIACAANGLRAGNASIAYELLNQTQRDLVSEPLREAARVHLFWYLASEEASLHWPLPNRNSLEQVTQAGAFPTEADPVRPISFATPVIGEPVPLPAAHATARPLTDDETLRARWRQATVLVEAIQAQQPDLFFEPMVRFPLAALQYRTGQPEAATKFWRSQLSGRTDPAYRSWAASELALLEPNSLPSRPSWNCPRLAQPPRLDGQLNEAVWQAVPVTPLHGPRGGDNASSSTQVRLAYDPEYLYLAIQADKIPTLTYEPSQQTRRRDEVLEGDRVEVYLDVDRDAVTHWCLSIDYRGWASERLNDDPSWNPQWYIAAVEDESTWTIEAAIPLTALSNQPVTPGVSWCLGVQRIMPSYDWETWLQPAPVESRPEEFGLLRFQ